MAPGENSVNCGVNRDAGESLHHWLHQIAESGERSVVSGLAGAIAETLGPQAVRQLIADLQRTVKVQDEGDVLVKRCTSNGKINKRWGLKKIAVPVRALRSVEWRLG
ncbi:hypothetical protein Poly51_02050 [Rubripirellula tenax]|uniref:Uncharacterized protein n=1 Tax=Rubripirellula tenax TaxID=2528015 RepID=A0A5C6FJU2_9BACT|nr:hypothetical protein [Rubripirellula tenax]TWU59932.1 hypothetical protein Poly51_02050 [Rubripirellula tenax]